MKLQRRSGTLIIAGLLVTVTLAAGLAVRLHTPSWVRTKREVKKAVELWREWRVERDRKGQASRVAVTELPPIPEEPRGEPVAAAPVTVPRPTAAAWPGFRGSLRDGIVREASLALDWAASAPRLMWKQPVGGGESSFAIAWGRAYTMEQRGGDEAITCYDLGSGRELWTARYPGRFTPDAMGLSGPRATPTIAGDRVYALGATGVLSCVRADTGKLIWRRNALEDAEAQNITWGMAGSPLVYRGKVYVGPGGRNTAVIAYDARTGEPVWKSGDHKAGYASPMLARLANVQHLLVFDGDGLSAYHPETGKPLWHYPWITDFGVNASQPVVVDHQHVLLSSAYDRGAALLKVAQVGEGLGVEPVWTNKNLKLKAGGAVLHKGFIYGPDDAILVCIDPRTGERCWKGGRYGYSQVLLAADRLVIQCQNGDLAMVAATSEGHREVSRVSALDGETWNYPAIGEGKLLLRNDREMMCYDLSRAETTPVTK
jgi:outer membrane protein assembly factor BamB